MALRKKSGPRTRRFLIRFRRVKNFSRKPQTLANFTKYEEADGQKVLKICVPGDTCVSSDSKLATCLLRSRPIINQVFATDPYFMVVLPRTYPMKNGIALPNTSP